MATRRDDDADDVGVEIGTDALRHARCERRIAVVVLHGA
jgi:hypothetical protein